MGFCTQGVHSGLVGQEDNERDSFHVGGGLDNGNRIRGMKMTKMRKALAVVMGLSGCV